MNILSSNSKPNRDIRLAVADEGFYLWQLAAELGITDGTLSKKLRRELSEKEKRDCFAAIERMKKLDRSLIEFDHQIFRFTPQVNQFHQ